jgi:hypothetical protein
MTAKEYLAALDRLGLSQVGAAPLIGLSRRQAQRLAAGESKVPPAIAKLLRLVLAGKISLDDLRRA